MPRRTWKAPPEAVLKSHFETYPCPTGCAARQRMTELFGVATTELDTEVRTNGVAIAPAKQLVNGPEMRRLISTMLRFISEGLRNGRHEDYPKLSAAIASNRAQAMGYIIGAISDFCFNMEYVRRITDNRWSYCNAHGKPRLFYPYLGVCPYCVLRKDKLANATLGAGAGQSEEEVVSRARYFGNKIESHHVGRIGERVIVYLLDLITKSARPDSTSLLIFDDQHDVDAAFFFDGIGVLAQIKSSPLILLPVVSSLKAKLTEGVDEETSLPKEKKNHTFTGHTTADHDLHLYFSSDDTTLPLGPKGGASWPYHPFLENVTEEQIFRIVENWISIYLSFAIPKRMRTDDDIKRAYLTSGWGAPIDDNKTKAGLARSDNMMKGTYACLKYGAYYVQECQRKTLKTALVANIDPAHQYADYLEKLEDIRWGHDRDFTKSDEGPEVTYTIAEGKLTYLFDSVFTFNRQIINDPTLSTVWDLAAFYDRMKADLFSPFISSWGKL